MNKQTDLLPWILGGLSVSAVAVAIAFVSGNKPLSPGLPTRSAVSLPAPATPALSPPTMAAPSPAATKTSPPITPPITAPVTPSVGQMTAQDLAPPEVPAESSAPAGQIWQCTTNGLKTFSNNPCGSNSSLVQVRPINTMSPTPLARSTHPYPPAAVYSQPYTEQNSYPDQDDYAEQNSANADNSYAAVPGFAYLPRKRHEHPHRPFPHHESGPPRKNSGPARKN
jgi:hypothetical protein